MEPIRPMCTDGKDTWEQVYDEAADRWYCPPNPNTPPPPLDEGPSEPNPRGE